MLTQLFLGSVVLIITICIEAAFFTVAIRQLARHAGWLRTHPRWLKMLLVLILVTLWLLAAISAAVSRHPVRRATCAGVGAWACPQWSSWT